MQIKKLMSKELEKNILKRLLQRFKNDALAISQTYWFFFSCNLGTLTSVILRAKWIVDRKT
jgi:hypothetical protein